MKRLLLGTLFAMCAGGAQAQFTPAVLPDVAFPSAPRVLRPDDLHSYTAHVSISGNPYDLYVYGWNSGGTTGEGFAWRLMSGSTLVNAGSVPIPNSSSIDLGIVQESSTGIPKVIVGYHKTGAGHILDIYNATIGGLLPVSSTTLSGPSALPRIAVDAHRLYGVLVAWSDPALGIRVRTLNTNTGPLVWGPQYTLAGTVKCIDPDITFTHAGGPLNGHIVFRRGAPDQLEEQRMDFFAMHGGGGGIYGGIVEDAFPIPGGYAVGIASIDAPEHGAHENWAYSFALQSTSTFTGPIIARVRDVVGGVVNQYDVTEGPFGSTPVGPFDLSGFPNGGPFSGYTRSAPCIAYDDDEHFFRVAWFNESNPFSPGQYLVQKMDVAGNFANPGATYLEAEIAPANNVSGTRCITLTPNNEFPFDFSAYGYYDNINNYSIKVKTIPWTFPSFRKAPEGTGLTQQVAPDFSIYPNPSKSAPVISFKGALGDADVDAVVLSNAGQVVATIHGAAQSASVNLAQQWDNLPAGQYYVRIYSASLNFTKTVQITKL